MKKLYVGDAKLPAKASLDSGVNYILDFLKEIPGGNYLDGIDGESPEIEQLDTAEEASYLSGYGGQLYSSKLVDNAQYTTVIGLHLRGKESNLDNPYATLSQRLDDDTVLNPKQRTKDTEDPNLEEGRVNVGQGYKLEDQLDTFAHTPEAVEMQSRLVSMLGAREPKGPAIHLNPGRGDFASAMANMPGPSEALKQLYVKDQRESAVKPGNASLDDQMGGVALLERGVDLQELEYL